ncbi:hypothetical protein COV82_04590 [Candidatus Peregrinibacteria bacterium CG11_big_fil_rev_8_21_14_0_20_46_8]|nr:MAG: hypothetical protein COV82_04590 [Candidatus Peregrinibacteria bacterium CG11_big_fil_rev_8_21_14_0_20_46_8]
MSYATIAFIVLVLLIISIRQINEYQRGIMFTIGKYSGVKKPGWRLVIPIFQSMRKVDLRVKTIDVPDQEAITGDNISVRINAVLYFKIKEQDADRAILQVEDFYYATSQLAQTTMRNAVGEVELDHLLQNRQEVSDKIKEIVDKLTDPWGIEIVNVELKDVLLPQELQRVIAKQAEAEREKRAVIIKAEGEVMAAANITKAAEMMSHAPGALHLRTLQSINDLSSDQSNTTIWMVPLEALRAMESLGAKLGKQ